MSTSFQYMLKKVRETKGAVLFQEIDSTGRDLDQHSGKVNTQYFRKHAFVGAIPETMTITVSYE